MNTRRPMASIRDAAQRLAALIVETAQRNGLAGEAGIDRATGPDEALKRIDAWLCDLKDLAIKDGLHIYGRTPGYGRTSSPDAAALPLPLQGGGSGWGSREQIDGTPTRTAARSDLSLAGGGDEECAAAERTALLAALDGRRVAPGPAGAPTRGRRDVLPTGRNLYTADPRMLPTPTAMDLGALAADEVIRAHLQTHGEMPRALVVDLWGSATLRTGGEEIAQSLAYLGCRPTWDHGTGRVTGIEVLPLAEIGRARIDVTWRISGLFRDLFPAQIALLDAAVQAVAAREEDGRRQSARRGAPGRRRQRARAHFRHRTGRLRGRRRRPDRARQPIGADRSRLSGCCLAFLRRRARRGRGIAGRVRAARGGRRSAGASGR